jgi:hypothetical protein
MMSVTTTAIPAGCPSANRTGEPLSPGPTVPGYTKNESVVAAIALARPFVG